MAELTQSLKLQRSWRTRLHIYDPFQHQRNDTMDQNSDTRAFYGDKCADRDARNPTHTLTRKYKWTGKRVEISLTHRQDTAPTAKFIIPKLMTFTLSNVMNVCTDTFFSRGTIFLYLSSDDIWIRFWHSISYTELCPHRKIFYVEEQKAWWTHMGAKSRQTTTCMMQAAKERNMQH